MCSEHDKIHNLSLNRAINDYLPSPVVDELVMLVVKFTFHIKECKPRLVVCWNFPSAFQGKQHELDACYKHVHGTSLQNPGKKRCASREIIHLSRTSDWHFPSWKKEITVVFEDVHTDAIWSHWFARASENTANLSNNKTVLLQLVRSEHLVWHDVANSNFKTSFLILSNS